MQVNHGTDGLVEVGVHHFFIEASTLGLKPGEFPRTVQTNIGNGQPFMLVGLDREGGHQYSQALGCVRLTIAND